MNIHFANAWLRSFQTGPDAVLTFYADEFDFADPPQERFICNDREALARAFRPLANKDPSNGLGIHRFKAVEYIGDQHAGLVLWTWSASSARRIFGLDAHGAAIRTTGLSYHVYRDGKIAREIVYSDQIHVAQQLGIPVRLRPLNAKPRRRTTRRSADKLSDDGSPPSATSG